MKVKEYTITIIEKKRTFLPIPFFGSYKQCKRYAQSITGTYQTYNITCNNGDCIILINSKLITQGEIT